MTTVNNNPFPFINGASPSTTTTTQQTTDTNQPPLFGETGQTGDFDFAAFISSKKTADLNKDGIVSIGEILALENDSDVDDATFQQAQLRYIDQQLSHNQNPDNFFDLTLDGVYTEEDYNAIRTILEDNTLSTNERNLFTNIYNVLPDLLIRIPGEVPVLKTEQMQAVELIQDLIRQIDKNSDGKISLLEKIIARSSGDFDGNKLKGSDNDKEIYDKLIKLYTENPNFIEKLSNYDGTAESIKANFSKAEIDEMIEILELKIGKGIIKPILPEPPTPKEIEEVLYKTTFSELSDLYQGLDKEKILNYLCENPEATTIKYKNDEGSWIHIRLNDDKSISDVLVGGQSIKMTKNPDGSITKHLSNVFYELDEQGNIIGDPMCLVGGGVLSYTLMPDGTIYLDGYSGLSRYRHTYKGGNLAFLDVDSNPDLSDYYLAEEKRYEDFNKTNCTTTTFDENGNVLSTIDEIDYENDGIVDEVEKVEYEYDENGQITSLKKQHDFDNDGTFDVLYQEEYEYDENGQLTSLKAKNDYENDGTFDVLHQEEYEYDENGQITSYKAQNDYENDGKFDDLYQEEHKYNNGQLSEVTVKQDYENDGTFDVTNTQKFSYFKNGNVAAIDNYLDLDNDGVVDEKTNITFTYNTDGSIRSSVYAADTNNDGTIDSRLFTQYDSNLNVIQEINVLYDDETGTIASTKQTNNQYNEFNELISTQENYDWDGDGVTDEFYEMSYLDSDNDGILDYYKESAIFFENGLKTAAINTYDLDLDGVGDMATSVQYIYDEAGNLKEEISEVDYDGDGIADSRTNTLYNYGTYISTEKYEKYILTDKTIITDFDADGVADQTMQEINSYTVQENGEITFDGSTRLTDFDGDNINDLVEIFDSEGDIKESKQTFIFDATGDGVDDITYLNKTYFKNGLVASDSTETLFDINGDNILDSSKTTNYYNEDGSLANIETEILAKNDKGNILTYIYANDENADNINDTILRDEYSYYHDGETLKEEIFGNDFDGNGVFESKQIFQYDSNGVLKSEIFMSDSDQDGNYDIIHTKNHKFVDDTGMPIIIPAEQIVYNTIEDVDGDGIADNVSRIYNMDEDGSIQSITEERALKNASGNIKEIQTIHDWDADFQIDYSTSSKYGADGELSAFSDTSYTYKDLDGDGFNDEIAETTEYEVVNGEINYAKVLNKFGTITYTSNPDQVAIGGGQVEIDGQDPYVNDDVNTQTWDSSLNDLVDIFNSNGIRKDGEETTYSENGLLTSSSTEILYDINGDDILDTCKTTNYYNEDGSVASVVTEIVALNDKGSILKYIAANDENADGLHETIFNDEYSYYDDGETIKESIFRTDFDGNNIFEIEQRLKYNENGEPIDETVLADWDQDGNYEVI